MPSTQQTFAMRARQQGTNDTDKARQATLALHPIVDGGWTAH